MPVKKSVNNLVKQCIAEVIIESSHDNVKQLVKECILEVLRENLSTDTSTQEKAYDFGWSWGRFDLERGESHPSPVSMNGGSSPTQQARSVGYEDGFKGIYKNIFKRNSRENPHPQHEGFDPLSQGPNLPEENPYPQMNAKMRKMEENEHGRYAQQAGAGEFDPRTFGVNENDLDEMSAKDAYFQRNQLANQPKQKPQGYPATYAQKRDMDLQNAAKEQGSSIDQVKKQQTVYQAPPQAQAKPSEPSSPVPQQPSAPQSQPPPLASQQPSATPPQPQQPTAQQSKSQPSSYWEKQQELTRQEQERNNAKIEADRQKELARQKDVNKSAQAQPQQVFASAKNIMDKLGSAFDSEVKKMMSGGSVQQVSEAVTGDIDKVTKQLKKIVTSIGKVIGAKSNKTNDIIATLKSTNLLTEPQKTEIEKFIVDKWKTVKSLSQKIATEPQPNAAPIKESIYKSYVRTMIR